MIENFKSAFISLWGNKVRSLLNIVGVVIGVSSVTILIALGEGLKKDVSGLIQGFGTNVIAITGGKIDTKNPNQAGSNPANFITGDILTMKDVATIENVQDIEVVSPASLVAGTLKYSDKLATPTLFGVYPSFLQALDMFQIEKGDMFTKRNQGHVVVLGSTAVDSLFGDVNPIGKTVTLGKTDFEVIGTMKTKKKSSVFSSEFDSFSLIPFDTATELNKGQEKVHRIYSKAGDTSSVTLVKDEIKNALIANHDGEEDFTVLTQDDLLGLFNTFLNLATTMVSAIAAISLLVGGIGIMNIMLVTVTERTREIGLRKAVGATKGAILTQFLVEAVVVTAVGALIGLGIALIAATIVAAKTELTPSVTPAIILIAVGISVIVGIVFGLWPAIRAANKDPIEALRYE